MGAEVAKQLAERQRRYDLIHHRMRVAYFKSIPDPHFWQRELLKESLQILSEPCLGNRSVDLSNTAYLTELDEWNSSTDNGPGG